MVLKPSHGVSAVGVSRIKNSDELRGWVERNGQNYSTYLAEEELTTSTEYVLLALVKGRHVQFFSSILTFIKSSLISISCGQPMALVSANHSQELNDKARIFATTILQVNLSVWIFQHNVILTYKRWRFLL